MLRSAAVALRTCTVSFSGPSGIRHSVDVTADSVYEAAVLGHRWADGIAAALDETLKTRRLKQLLG